MGGRAGRFEAFERRLGPKLKGRAAAAVALRKGVTLVELGRPAPAIALLRDGLAGIAGDADLVDDRKDATIALGRALFAELDYAGAAVAVEAAIALATTPSERLTAEILATQVTMFDVGDAALAHADKAMALATTMGELGKKPLAQIRTVRARVLLNHGDSKGGHAELRKALAAQGGLTDRVTLADVATRADLGLAALLVKDTDAAREYLAFTGAGRMKDTPFETASDMEPPACGGPAGLKPDDAAIIEFVLSERGEVVAAKPIYVSRLGPPALAFAQAVRDWSWRPEAAAKIPPFYRAATRVELRCSTAGVRPDVDGLLRDALVDWASGIDVVENTGTAAVALPKLTAAIAALGGADDKRAVLLLITAADNPVAAPADSAAWWQRVQAMRTYRTMPIAARIWVELRYLRNWSNRIATALAQRLETMEQPPEIAADPLSSGVLRLTIADLERGSKPLPANTARVEQVADDTRLPARHPLRVAALVRLANRQVATGAIEAARASFQKTGLDAQSCALVDANPILSGGSIGDNAFPIEAARWGFSGWVRLQFDIDASGRVQAPRAIIAYPPFVFRDAAVGSITNLRFRQTYRPDGAVGCGGKQQQIVFSMMPSR